MTDTGTTALSGLVTRNPAVDATPSREPNGPYVIVGACGHAMPTVMGWQGSDTDRAYNEGAAAARAEMERENRIMRAALTRLRDCDWTITPLDRMDAVRDIARSALEGREDRPHD